MVICWCFDRLAEGLTVHKHDNKPVDFGTYLFPGSSLEMTGPLDWVTALNNAPGEVEGYSPFVKSRDGETWGSYLPRVAASFQAFMKQRNLWQLVPADKRSLISLDFGGYTPQPDGTRLNDGEIAAELFILSGEYNIYVPFMRRARL